MKLSDQELLDELKARFEANKKALEEQQQLMTQLQIVNHKLEKSEKVKSQFLSNIKNEINNPLASILGLSRNIFSFHNLSPERISSSAELIFSEAFNLDFQMSNIFMAAEIEAGEAFPNFMHVDIHQLLTHAVEGFAHLTKKKNIQIELINEDGVSTNEEFIFITDSEKLHRIIINLLSNAIEFGGNNGKVVIIVGKVDNQLKVAIQDFGVGIPEEQLPMIFDRFRQLDTGTTKTYGGHGLGLSIAKALVDILEAKIEVSSKMNEGSTFTVSIPQASEENMISDDFSSDGNEFFFDADETF
ncbi:MAG: HAMP domain-containing histidine kinase [Cytophagales bacterium]|nr:HAMP domain-containing histidine kinase [Cytophagales bacterium]